MISRITHLSKLAFLIFIALPVALPLQASQQNQLIQRIYSLEKDYRNLSSAFYKDSGNYPENARRSITEIEQLLNQVIQLQQQKNPIAAIQLLHSNISTVRDNLDHQAIFTFMPLLLDQNEWKLANSLYTDIENEADKSLLANIQFIFAKYHAQRNEWSEVNKRLLGIFSELSADDAAYAYILQGSALQHLKQHRKAADSYSKIPENSSYYPYAQLNIAIANIRQGWWTDARNTINALIKQSRKDNTDEFTNRLYLVLGYALLQREYYRDARNAFRQVGLNTRYTNRALLGIGLTATSQGDYVGGLNALTILKNKKTSDLSVDESYLLVPYVYEKLQQELTVTTSYTEAMNYYQRRIESLENIKNRKINFQQTVYRPETGKIIIQNNSFNYDKRYPGLFIRNYQQLMQFSTLNKNRKLRKKINKLISRYDNLFQNIIADLIDQRISYLKSYLNQSRYGLARMYDNSSKADR